MERKVRKKIIKSIGLILLSFFLIFLIFTPIFNQKIYFILSKTSLYNTVSLMKNEDHHDEEEERELIYFEDEFKNQPYASPLPSSVELIQLSLAFIILSFVINKMKSKN